MNQLATAQVTKEHGMLCFILPVNRKVGMK